MEIVLRRISDESSCNFKPWFSGYWSLSDTDDVFVHVHHICLHLWLRSEHRLQAWRAFSTSMGTLWWLIGIFEEKKNSLVSLCMCGKTQVKFDRLQMWPQIGVLFQIFRCEADDSIFCFNEVFNEGSEVTSKEMICIEMTHLKMKMLIRCLYDVQRMDVKPFTVMWLEPGEQLLKFEMSVRLLSFLFLTIIEGLENSISCLECGAVWKVPLLLNFTSQVLRSTDFIIPLEIRWQICLFRESDFILFTATAAFLLEKNKQKNFMKILFAEFTFHQDMFKTYNSKLWSVTLKFRTNCRSKHQRSKVICSRACEVFKPRSDCTVYCVNLAKSNSLIWKSSS